MNHPLRNFQRGPTWSSNNDPLVARNRIMDDLQFLPGIRMKSIVDRDSGTIGILECCSITSRRGVREQICRIQYLDITGIGHSVDSPLKRAAAAAVLPWMQRAG